MDLEEIAARKEFAGEDQQQWFVNSALVII
jgi:hypothetical protein